MKSYLSVLPFVGSVLAQSQCGPRETVTEIQVERVTVTVQPSEYAAAVPAVTPVAESSEAAPTPAMPYYPITNGTSNCTSSFLTHTPLAPTTFETFVFPTSLSSSKKPVQTVYISPSPVEAPTNAASQPAAIPASSAPATADTASKESTSAAGSVKGTATFYGGNVDGGHCSFSGYTIPAGLFGTAFGGNWDASQCGACVSVKGPKGQPITAMIVDQCPECTTSHLDLFESAFTQIGDKSAGIIDISYSFVPCGITSPIVLKNKSGTSANWFSMQVVNSNVAIAKLEVSTNGGSTWQGTTRQPYNFFENSAGFKTASVDVKITSTDGRSIVVKSVGVSSGSSKTASGNFS